MSTTIIPDNFLLFNDYSSKNIVCAVQIDGVDLLSNINAYEKWRYGDPDLKYGFSDAVYGGMKPVANQRNILSLDGGLTISQRLEPEQGRGAISTITMAFIDKDQYMTQVCSPGVIVNDLLGKRVKVWLGYQQLSFPEDYYVVFRGVVTSIEAGGGLIRLQFSDPNVKRKSNIFYSATTKTASSITGIATTIPVTSNSDFHKKILGPNGTYDPAIKTYIKIDNEFIEYSQTGSESVGFGTNQFVNVLRGQRGTTAEAHDADADVSAAIEIQDHAIDMALKLMLSGWNGVSKTGCEIRNLVNVPSVGLVSNAIVLPYGGNAFEDHGLVTGDYLYITGDPTPGNNITCRVQGFGDLFGLPNQIIYVDQTLTESIDTPATFSIRSQYDVYPESCGAMLTGEDVDIQTHLTIKDTFLSQPENTLRFFITEQQSCKTWIESEIYLPVAGYSLTRYGRLSMGYTKPPIADQRLQILSSSNIINAPDLKTTRATNNRKFFNQVDYSYDAADDGTFTNIVRTFDSNSLNTIGISMTLPIKSLGSRTDLGFQVVQDKRTRFFLERYKIGAIQISPKVSWALGCQIEAGDVVAVQDNGDLSISNFATGARTLGTQLFEVIDRQLNVKEGNVQLTLLGGIASQAADRYATISPSSLVSTGSTTTLLRIKDSFGALYPGDERKKWEDYVGLKIKVHSRDYTAWSVTTILSMSAGDGYAINIEALPWAPAENYIVDLDDYPDNNDPSDQALAKSVHVFLDPSVLVLSGISDTQFTVSVGDIDKFITGEPVLIHNSDWSILSPEVLITDVSGLTITVDGSLGFTPALNQRIELIGFKDGGAPYRFV